MCITEQMGLSERQKNGTATSRQRGDRTNYVVTEREFGALPALILRLGSL